VPVFETEALMLWFFSPVALRASCENGALRKAGLQQNRIEHGTIQYKIFTANTVPGIPVESN
jgi:hypothetical protein